MLVINAFFENGKFVLETRATITIEDTSERMAWNEIPRVRAAWRNGSSAAERFITYMKKPIIGTNIT
jgi:hypothetical protein